MPIMNSKTRKSYAGLIGLGFMYMWCCAALYWVGSGVWFIGAGLVSVSGIAVFFYVNSLEKELNSITQRNEQSSTEAMHWKSQAQIAIAKLESSSE
ncbi:MAG: hypothetical protein A2143_00635 [Gallionellales bacterium RBG_16_57_15]|nr:MAG: hypothetical protein A2143_00635 [Gallionellales bacterium RBG_16_57_15]